MPEDLQVSAMRYYLNVRLTDKNKPCRATGFDKHLTRADYNNQDLHDQLLYLTGFSAKLPITMLFEAESLRKSTKLIAATSRGVYALNNSTGNWKVISDALGNATTRWKSAMLRDTVILTNNVDPVVYWQFDQGVTEADDQSVSPIAILTSIGITKAGVVVVWKDTAFLMNVVVNGSVQGNSIYWSNYQLPLDWQPAAASTAGSADVGSGETILAALPLADRLIIYTNKGIWELVTNADTVFSLNKRYDPQAGEACLFYPNTLISIGSEHVYFGQDGIYVYSLYQEKPQRVDWMHKASSVIFDDINRDSCQVHCAGYDTERKEMYFSWARAQDTLPTQTLVLSTIDSFSFVMDYGFSAFVTYTLKEPVQALRDFLLAKCICSSSELETYWSQFTKEGGYCSTPTNPTCPDAPTSIWTVTPLDLGDGVITEDYTQVTADANSLCTQLGGITISSLCETEERSDECNSGKRFVAASSSDNCIKEFSDNYYREEYVVIETCTDGVSLSGASQNYQRLGYSSLWRSGPLALTDSKNDKLLTRLEVEASSFTQSSPSQFNLRIGLHSQAVDPNQDNCGIVWDSQDPKPITCKSDSAAVSAANKTLPSESYEWPLYYGARYVYFELSITNPNVSPPDTGGGCCLSRITLDMESVARNWMG